MMRPQLRVSGKRAWVPLPVLTRAGDQRDLGSVVDSAAERSWAHSERVKREEMMAA